jgi:hypothetical protein
MAVMAPIRVLAVLLVATCGALSQQQSEPASADLLPDAPSVQNPSAQSSSKYESFRTFLNSAGLPVTESAKDSQAFRFDPGHFEMQPIRKESADPLARLFLSSTTNNRTAYVSTSNSLMVRATDAASSVLFTHDEAGRKTLNTHYLLRVLISAAADSAHTPYWKRSASQPISDVGSTIGNDAGMKVFHEFEPGILQAVKRLQPKFIAGIGQRISGKPRGAQP